MARKIHLQANKALNQDPYAVCASRPAGNGKVRKNSRRTYAFMASEIVHYADFKNVPAADRCAHCMDMGLEKKNRARKAKGQPLAKSLFETLEAVS